MQSRGRIAASLVATVAVAAGLALSLTTVHVRGVEAGRLVKFEPGVEFGGQSCSWEAASMLEKPLPGYQGGGGAAARAGVNAERRAEVAKADPVRFIQDPYPGFLALTL